MTQNRTYLWQQAAARWTPRPQPVTAAPGPLRTKTFDKPPPFRRRGLGFTADLTLREVEEEDA